MARGHLAVGSIGVLALSMSCSLITSLDGLAGPPTGSDEAGAADALAPDGPASLLDAASTKPRAWRKVPVSGPPAVHSARMVFDEARGKAVLFGGGNSATRNDTWEWDGSAWSLAVVTARPSARQSPGLAYDSARHVIRLFAGSNGTDDPWEWDGGPAWRSSGSSASTPDIRYSTVMTYDRARDVLVLFGGLHAGPTDTDNPETWEWSAAGGFVKRTPALSPPPRHANVLVYDAARSRVVVFGGSDGSSRNDTWEWDGTGWAERTPPLSPPARRAACAAYDSVRKVTVVFGGRPEGTTSALDDTWEWDGKTWQRGAMGPPGRSSCAMAFDSTRNAVVMFGGSPRRRGKEPPDVLDDTWVYE
ncbi:MAG TPA: hypothetical protein VLT33_36510 [Labilithrix sp.]|nr:hypothetical protein [Labilithrix sp.]